MSRYTQTLDRISQILENMMKRVATIRQLYDAGMYQAAQVQMLRLEESSERLTLLTRSLPCYTGARSAPDDVAQIIRDAIPVEMGFTQEGWFSLRIPLLLPKKESGSVNYLRGFLLPAMEEFFRDKSLIRYPKCVLIYRHVYARDCPERRYRDHDNIEINLVSDSVALYTMPDDNPTVCTHFYCSAAGFGTEFTFFQILLAFLNLTLHTLCLLHQIVHIAGHAHSARKSASFCHIV